MLKKAHRSFLIIILIGKVLATTNGAAPFRKEENLRIKDDLAVFPLIREAIQKTSERPSLPFAITSGEGHFKIHYSLSGYDSVSVLDGNLDGIPDYINEVARTAERVYKILIDTLGFNPPPVDGIDGNEIDIYVVNLGGNYYGLTFPESEVTDTPQKADYTSYLEIDNDYAESSYNSKGLDGLHVTIAHEFFHMVQLGYNYFMSNSLSDQYGDTYFLEWNSIWFEERAYPEVNDYLYYISSFFINPSKSIWTRDYWYSLGIFLKFVLNKYGEHTLVKVWEKMRDENKYAMDAFNEVMEELNTNIFDLWNEFFTVIYYSDGKFLPEKSLTPDAEFFPELNYSFKLKFHRDDNTLSVTGRISPCGTLPVLVTFSGNQFTYLKDLKGNLKHSISRFLLDRYLYSDVTMLLKWYDDIFIGDTRLKDTLAIFITNANIDSSIQVSFGIVKSEEEPEGNSRIVSIYPNPILLNIIDKLNIELDIRKRYKNMEILIYDLLGRQIYRKKYGEEYLGLGQMSFEVDVNKLSQKNISSGVYILCITLDSEILSRKITILK